MASGARYVLTGKAKNDPNNKATVSITARNSADAAKKARPRITDKLGTDDWYYSSISGPSR